MYKRRNGRLSREQMSLCYSDAVVVSFSCVFFFFFFYLKFKSTHVHTDLQNRNARVRMTVQKNKTKISRYLHHVQTTNTTQILSRYCFFFFPPSFFPPPHLFKQDDSRNSKKTPFGLDRHDWTWTWEKIKTLKKKTKWQTLVVAVLTRIHKTTIRTLMLRN